MSEVENNFGAIEKKNSKTKWIENLENQSQEKCCILLLLFRRRLYRIQGKSSKCTGAAHDTSTKIDTTHGSVNTSGDEGYSANTPINVQVTGDDIEQASSVDSQKVIKVFIKDHSI
ncbi:hypothetical protein [Bacillus sp. SM2101]|uniref:hypothetical protein n=1 Tax=Bacillus sp. SM2101 TaxID=2805366 RepID=UPI001BDEC20E|nr:hypothetical protein [Bacillus sp. SM2101]